MRIVAMYGSGQPNQAIRLRKRSPGCRGLCKKMVEKFGEKNMSIDQIKSVALEQQRGSA